MLTENRDQASKPRRQPVQEAASLPQGGFRKAYCSSLEPVRATQVPSTPDRSTWGLCPAGAPFPCDHSTWLPGSNS